MIRRLILTVLVVGALAGMAAAFSGAADEERNADRIAQQSEELDRLVKQRDALPKRS